MKQLTTLLVLYFTFWSFSCLGQCGDCQYKTTNLVPNGNFEAGNIGFSSDYVYSSNLNPEGLYMIGANARNYHGNFRGYDHTTGSGKFMIVNGAPVVGTKVWCQTIVVLPNTDYNFSTWVASVHPSNPALLQFSINGVQIGDIFEAPNSTYTWEEFFVNWNSGNAITATICIENMSTIASGNDFGIDDISFAPCLDYNIVNRPLAGLDQTICSGESVSLGVPGSNGFTSNWAPASFFNDPNQLLQNITLENPGTTPITYTFTLTTDSSALGCVFEDEVVITVNPLPTIDLGNDTTLCNGPLTLTPTYTNGSLLEWTNGSNQETLVVSQTGTYGIQADLLGCKVTAEKTVTIDTIPTFELGNDISFCEGDSAIFNAPIAGLWNQAIAAPNWVSKTSEVIVFTATNGTCSFSDTVTITKNDYPIFDLGKDTVLCNTASYLVTEPISGLWNGTLSAPNVMVANDTTLHFVANNNGCITQDSVKIAFEEILAINLPSDTIQCGSDQLSIEIPLVNNQACIWNDGLTATLRTINAPGTYWVERYTPSCSAVDTINYDTIARIIPTLPQSLTACESNPAVIDYNLQNGEQILWDNGSTSPTQTFTTSGTYIATISNGKCSAIDSVVYVQDSLPVAAITAPSNFCDGDSVLAQITPQLDYLYEWSNGTNGTSQWISETENLTIEVINGLCTKNLAIEIQKDVITEIVLPDTVTSCYGTPLTIAANQVGTWSTGEIADNITVATSGWYRFEVQNGACYQIDSTYAFISELPAPEFFPLPVCSDDKRSVPFTHDFTQYNFHWTDNNSTDMQREFADSVGKFFYQFNDELCILKGFVNVSVTQKPNILLPDSIRICEGDNFYLSANIPSGFQFRWDNGNRTNKNRAINSQDQYTIVAWNSVCRATDTCDLWVETPPVLIQHTKDTICNGASITYDLPEYTGYQTSWLDATTSPKTFDNAGNYDYKVDNTVCEAFNQFKVATVNQPQVFNADSARFCNNDSLILQAQVQSPLPVTYFWNNEIGTATKTIFQPNTITLKAAHAFCATEKNIVVSQDQQPITEVPQTLNFCEGQDSTIVIQENANFHYAWNDGISTASRTFNTAGNYTLTISNSSCTEQKEVIVSEISYPNIDVKENYTFCENAGITIQPIVTNYTQWKWLQRNDQNTFFTQTDTLTLFASNAFCNASKQVVLHADSIPVLPLALDTTICKGDTLNYRLNTPYNYTWENGTNELIASKSGIYTYTLANETCKKSGSITLRTLTKPNLNYPDSFICEIDSVVFPKQINGYNYWVNGTLNTENKLTFKEAGLYQIMVENGICQVDDNVTISTEKFFQLDLGEDVTSCSNQAVTLTAKYPENWHFAWNDGIETPTRTLTEPALLIGVIQGERCFSSDVFELSHIAQPFFSLERDATLCEGDSLFIAPQNEANAFSWKWNDQAVSDKGARYFNHPGVYTLTAFNEECQFSRDVHIRFQENPLKGFINSQSACEDKALIFDLNNDPNYFYLFDGTIWEDDRIIIVEEGRYPILVNANGCSYTDTINATFIPYPELSITDSIRFCETDSFYFRTNTHPSYNYWWNDGVATANRNFSTAGTYILRAANQFCFTYDTLLAQTDETPYYNGTKNFTFCENVIEDEGISISSNYFNGWEGFNQDTLYPSASSVFPFILKNGLCTNTDSIQITILNKPITTPLAKEACIGDELEFKIDLDSTYQIVWSNNKEGNTAFFATNGNHFAVYDNGYCTDTIAVKATFHNLPIVKDISTKPVCEGNEFTLSYASNENELIAWTHPTTRDTVFGNNFSMIAPTNTMQLQIPIVVKNSSTKCSNDTLVTVNISNYPTLNLESTYIGCNSPVIVDLTTDADSIIWSNGAQGSVFIADSTDTFGLIAYKGACSMVDSINVHIINQPPIELGPDTFICNGDSLQLFSPIPVTWNTGEFAKSITVATGGMYSMEIASNGCKQTDSIYVAAYHLPEIDIKDTVACSGRKFKVPSSLDAYNITWYGSAPNRNNELSMAGNYTFKAEGVCGDSIFNFTLNYEDCNHHFFLPNAFTPNADGDNEMYAPVYEGMYNVEMLIFDRWGEEIVHQKDENIGWNGHYQGKMVQQGVYSVVVKGSYIDQDGNEVNKRVTGLVTLFK